LKKNEGIEKIIKDCPLCKDEYYSMNLKGYTGSIELNAQAVSFEKEF
jgi:hypothetical protein